MNNQAPGFADHPDHTVKISPFQGTVAISINGTEVARTDKALLLAEASYPAVFYLPVDIMPEGLLIESDHRTWCPFKGHASYFHLSFDGEIRENAVWCYRDPFDEALAIKDRIAFFQNAVSVSPVE